jgi:hypothetical protein
MPAALRYFLMEDGLRTGPHSLLVLRQKADIGVLTSTTPVAPETEPDTWAPLRDFQALCSELLPERPKYKLGAHPIKRVNTSATDAAPSVQEILSANLAREKAVQGDLLTPLRPRKNRRRTDYLIAASLINGLVIVNLFLGRPWYDPFLLGFFVMGNISLAWVLFGVMDRY